MSDRNNVVVLYDPITAALFLDGGFIIVLAFMLAAGIGVGVYAFLEKRVPKWGFWHNNLGWVALAAGVGSLFVMHLANVKGWF